MTASLMKNKQLTTSIKHSLNGALRERLRVHFAVCAAAGTAMLLASADKVDADIVYSGVVNITIPSTSAGVYLNVGTGANNSNPAMVTGWDVNLWGGTGFGLFSPSSFPGSAYMETAPDVHNLVAGTLISAASTFGGLPAANNNGQWNLNTSNNLVGFRFQNEANGNQTHYGWARILFSADIATQPRMIVDYAWEDQAGVGIQAGAIPAPGSLALLALGALASRRRRHG